jgi:hypothetical protein
MWKRYEMADIDGENQHAYVFSAIGSAIPTFPRTRVVA